MLQNVPLTLNGLLLLRGLMAHIWSLQKLMSTINLSSGNGMEVFCLIFESF